MKNFILVLAAAFSAPVLAVLVMVAAPIVAAVLAPVVFLFGAVFPVMFPNEWRAAKNGGF